jgi:hypothetical protein
MGFDDFATDKRFKLNPKYMNDYQLVYKSLDTIGLFSKLQWRIHDIREAALNGYIGYPQVEYSLNDSHNGGRHSIYRFEDIELAAFKPKQGGCVTYGHTAEFNPRLPMVRRQAQEGWALIQRNTMLPSRFIKRFSDNYEEAQKVFFEKGLHPERVYDYLVLTKSLIQVRTYIDQIRYNFVINPHHLIPFLKTDFTILQIARFFNQEIPFAVAQEMQGLPEDWVENMIYPVSYTATDK